MIRKKLPEVAIAYVSMKPSPDRAKYLPIMREGNQMIKEFMDREQNAEFIDIASLLLTKEGNFRPEIYILKGFYAIQISRLDLMTCGISKSFNSSIVSAYSLLEDKAKRTFAVREIFKSE